MFDNTIHLNRNRRYWKKKQKYVDMGILDIDWKKIGDWNDLYSKILLEIIDILFYIEENTYRYQKDSRRNK